MITLEVTEDVNLEHLRGMIDEKLYETELTNDNSSVNPGICKWKLAVVGEPAPATPVPASMALNQNRLLEVD